MPVPLFTIKLDCMPYDQLRLLDAWEAWEIPWEQQREWVIQLFGNEYGHEKPDLKNPIVFNIWADTDEVPIKQQRLWAIRKLGQTCIYQMEAYMGRGPKNFMHSTKIENANHNSSATLNVWADEDEIPMKQQRLRAVQLFGEAYVREMEEHMSSNKVEKALWKKMVTAEGFEPSTY